jgi:pyruvate/2-oxoglutarate dehydrogenase complex dihydrolipoamide dehydrogenase (E3) component
VNSKQESSIGDRLGTPDENLCTLCEEMMVYSLPLFEVKKEIPIETDIALLHRDSYSCSGMSTILVLGGGVIWLSMAMMLARQGHYVTVFERDGEPLPDSAEEAWHAWERRGVAQFRQAHYLTRP